MCLEFHRRRCPWRTRCSGDAEGRGHGSGWERGTIRSLGYDFIPDDVDGARKILVNSWASVQKAQGGTVPWVGGFAGEDTPRQSAAGLEARDPRDPRDHWGTFSGSSWSSVCADLDMPSVVTLALTEGQAAGESKEHLAPFSGRRAFVSSSERPHVTRNSALWLRSGQPGTGVLPGTGLLGSDSSSANLER